jgi:hypothetical protein|tara:strand:- start:1229 stop:1528 length:300 start_codon:yes stop_codon:yes gene_type:complete
MSRYTTTKVLKQYGEKRKLLSIIIPVIPESNEDTYIQTTSAERLDKLADTFYDDASLWWVIATCNGLGKGTLIIPPNTRVRIPANRNIQEIINRVNNSR